MVKSCNEIAKDIEELKKQIQQNKLIEMTLVDIAERRKCRSEIAAEICKNCNCWKIVREYSS